jgi:CheY-like chemotaxis protein
MVGGVVVIVRWLRVRRCAPGLPARRPALAPRAAGPQMVRSAPMANILIVDDDRDLADTLVDVLVELGHEVRVAHDGCEGLSRLDEAPLPDVVILDIEMPVLDGPGMANQMFILDAGKEKVPIILISGFVNMRATAARVGTPYFAPKPCSLDTIVGLLERALRERTPPAPILPCSAAPAEPRGERAPTNRGRS